MIERKRIGDGGEQSLRDLSDNNKGSNICVNGIQYREEKECVMLKNI